VSTYLFSLASILHPRCGSSGAFYRYCQFFLLLCLVGSSAGLANAEEIVAQFSDRIEAEELANSLRTLGNKAHSEKRSELITLQTLSLGPFPTRQAAALELPRLREAGIQAYIHPAHEGYVIHAGALREEKHFNERYQLLKELGYEQVLTGKADHTRSHYVVISVPQLRGSKHTRHWQKSLQAQHNRWQSNTQQRNFDHVQLQVATAKPRAWTIGLELDASSDDLSTTAELSLWNTRFAKQTPFGHYALLWNTPQPVEHIYDLWLQPLAQRDLRHYSLGPTASSASLSNLLQAQWTLPKYTLGLHWQPLFRATELPAMGADWHPVNTQLGRLRGLKTNSALTSVLNNQPINHDAPQYGGVTATLQRKIHHREQTFLVGWLPFPDVAYRVSNNQLQLFHPQVYVLSLHEATPTFGFQVSLVNHYPLLQTDLSHSSSLALFAATWYQLHLNHGRTQLKLTPHLRQLGAESPVLNQTTRARFDSALVHRLRYHPAWQFGGNLSLGFYLPETRLSTWLRYRWNSRMQLRFETFRFWGMLDTEYGYQRDHDGISLIWQANF
jgi:hypothetical protein